MNIVRMVIEYASCFLEIALVAYFASSFQSARFSMKKRVMIFTLIAFLYGNAVAILPPGNALFVVSIAATLAVVLCYTFKWYTAIFVSLTFSIISALAELIVMGIVTMGGKNFEEANANIFTYIGGLLASKMITYLITLIIRKKRYRSFQSVGEMRFVGLLMLPCSSIMMSMVYSYLMLHYQINAVLEFLSIFALICLLISNAMIFYIVDRQYEIISSKEKLKMSKVLLENQKQYYEDAFRSQQEIRKIRHDLKNIFIALQGALNAEDIGLCKEIIQEKFDELEQHVDLSTKATNMLDSIIYSKQREAQGQDVALDIKKSINRPVMIDCFDLAILVANILDNAIEAASAVSGNKEVSFSILTDNDSLVVLSYNSTINTSFNENMKTTKKDNRYHGYGLMSIKSIAEKYNGSYSMTYHDGFATVTVVLTNQKPVQRNSNHE